MKENSLPTTTIFKRRRVLLAAFALALLAVAGVFLMPSGEPADPVKATFVGFSKSTNDGAPLVVLRLTNESNRTFFLITHDKLETFSCGFRRSSSTNETNEITRITPLYSKVISVPLLPFSGTTCQVELPQDGRSGWPAVFCNNCYIGPQRASGLRGKIQTLWWRLRPPRDEFTWAACDREIQCPKVLPDGTVEQPRLVLKEEHQSD